MHLDQWSSAVFLYYNNPNFCSFRANNNNQWFLHPSIETKLTPLNKFDSPMVQGLS